MGNPRKQISSKGRKLNYIVTSKQKNFLRNSPPSVPRLSPDVDYNQGNSQDFCQSSETIQPINPGYFAQAGQRSPNANFGSQNIQDFRRSPEFYNRDFYQDFRYPEHHVQSGYYNFQSQDFRRSPDYCQNQFQPTIGFNLDYFPEIKWENFNQDKTSKKFEEFEKMWNTNEEESKSDLQPKCQSTPKKEHHKKPYEKVTKEDKLKIDCEILAKELIDIILQQSKNAK